MNIVVLAGGLSTERDVSFKSGDMVCKALRSLGHKVLLLDVFLGYHDTEEDISDIFEHTEEDKCGGVRYFGYGTGHRGGQGFQSRPVRLLLWTECDRDLP